jgi:uncharacterized repeat protein (TIGR01451 family)
MQIYQRKNSPTKKEKIMTRKQPQITGRVRASIGALALMVLVAFGAPLAAQASTSANATIFNEVTVSYQSGTTILTAMDDVSVTVATLAAAPTVTVDTTAQTTTAGSNVDYVYTVRSNSNGPDTYTTTSVDSTDTDISLPTNSDPGAVTLWGGIVLSAGAGTINLPGGSTTGLADGDTVELSVNGSMQRYTVTIAAAGSPASSGSAEVLAVVTLAPVAGADAITAGNVADGIQVGQYDTITLTQTAGTPTTAGSDGTHVTTLELTTTATDAFDAAVTYTTSAGDSNEVTTTVSSPEVTITKAADVASAKPGELITYTVTVENTHASATATNVTVSDAVPAYTTLVASGGNFATADLNGGGAVAVSTAVDDENVDVASGSAVGTVITFYLGTGQDGSSATGGSLDAGDEVVITYQVTVN